MDTYIGRYNSLKKRLNNHLKKLTGIEKDYFSDLNQNDLLELKSVLYDINNVLTLKVTLSAADWICDFFKVSNSEKKEILEKIDNTKPNANGFDINIKSPKKIIAEVKCIIPINNGNKYGGAQWNSILDDAYKLKNGKRELTDTSDYYKFLFLIDIGERTDQAISSLLKESKPTSDKLLRTKRHEIKKHIILHSDNQAKLRLDKIYFKTIKID